MKKTNDSYCIVLRGKRVAERYYRDRQGWVKISTKDLLFRATAEQVLNHLLPTLAIGEQLDLTVEVEHYEVPYWTTLTEDHSSN